jgi:hypothetical protein
LMANRLNTILVVVSLPLLSAVTLYWTRNRNSVRAATASTTSTTTTNTTSDSSEAPVEENNCQPLQSSLTPHHPQSHHTDNRTADGKEVTSLSSSSAPAPAIEQPASHPAVVDPDSLSEGQHSAGAPHSRIIMQIADTSDLSQQPAANPESQSPEVTANGSPAAMNGHQQQERSNGVDVAGDVSSKEKSKIRKEPESAAKKNGSSKKEKNHISSSSDQKEKKLPNGQSAVSEGQSRSEDLPARSRKNHDSGGSVGASSVDSGADVMSPASSDSKSSDRSVDSPGVFKSDASQGSPCHWGTSDSHSEVTVIRNSLSFELYLIICCF